MKIGVFSDTEWSMGRVHKDVAKHLPDMEFKYIDWSHYWNQDTLNDLYNECDVVITNVAVMKDILHMINPKKTLFISHGFEEFHNQPLNSEYTYSMTSESIADIFPVGAKVFLTPNGVDPSQFNYRERDGILNNLGWCGNPHIWCKQSYWAIEISKQTNIPLQISSKVPCETDMSKWSRMNYDEVREWYNNIDLLLITSIPSNPKHETGPLGAFEAVVSGIPVIGTPVGNFKNIPGPKFQTIEEAVSIINELKSHPDRLKTLAKEQYDYVMKHYTYESFIHKWREALEYVKSRSSFHN